jgi:GNAT superfamily N-acetyltransferase
MVSFRESATDDASAHELLAEYFAARAETFPPELGKYTTNFPEPKLFEGENGVFLVVEDIGLDDEPADVGCGGIKRLGPTTMEVKHLYLRPFLRGRGLGRVVLAELERRAREFGATEVVLDTNASLTAAGALYRTSGYVDIEPYNDNPNATNWYRKDLSTAG